MTLALAGISHHRAPVELRERVALDARGAQEAARRLADEVGEAVCLSTCNRTELYAVGAGAEAAAEAALVGLGGEEVAPALYRLRDQAAALHLFRVAAGLDSMVPGEGEILGQVRVAYESGAAGPVLDRLFRQALHSGRKARAETAIGERPASVSSAAAALAEQVFGDLRACRVMLVGAGEVGEATARNLVARGAELALVANRGRERAERLVSRLGGVAVPLERAADELRGVDVLVASTGAPGLVLGRDAVARAMRARKGRPLFLIDLAVPRDLDPSIAGLDGCYLYDLDDLEAVVAETLAGRRKEAERAERIVAEEAERFREWHASLEVVPAIASLRARAEEIRRAELRRAEARLGRLTEGERSVVESVTAQIVNKLLHLPTVRMKEAAAAADGVLYAETVRHLFGLGEEER